MGKIMKVLITIDSDQLDGYDQARKKLGNKNRSEHVRALMQKFCSQVGAPWPNADYANGVTKYNRSRGKTPQAE